VPIDRHGGTVEKFIGDAVMAAFGVPQVHEDDALRAVRAAAEMREVLDGLNPELGREHGVTLACRIGVNTGEVVAGSTDAVVVGDTVNVAARLEQAAEPGEILLGIATYRLVREAVSAEPVEALDLKGKAEPVPAFRLLDVTPGAAGFARHLDAPIVGRERELTLLRGAFDRTVTDDACQLFTVLGVAGVGKSRLMAAFVDEVGDRATILRGRCLPYGEGITFYPLAEALIEQAGLADSDSPEAARAKLGAIVGGDATAGRVAALVGQAIGIPGSEAAPGELSWAVRTLLEHLASDRPLVFVIDDLQWAEPRFLELLEHVADFATDAPILLACMARPELLDEHPGWAGGKLNATSILLEPLDPGACGALVANLLTVAVDEAVRDRIVDAAGGNPLFAEEVTGLLVDEGHVALEEGRWVTTGDLAEAPVPPTIAALLAARLDTLPAPERRLLDVASVMGQVFYPAAVRAIARQGPDAVAAGLRSLVRHQFVRQERSDLPETEAFAFRHLLIRDAAYDSIAKAERAELHERFAGWLDGLEGALGEQDEIVGHHLEQAYRYRSELGTGSDGERALGDAAGRRLASAGRQAFVRGDRSATINLLSRAAGLLRPDDPLRVDVLTDLGSTLPDVGDWDGGRDAFDEAIERATAAGDDRMRMRAIVRRRLELGDVVGDARGDAEAALAVFERAGDDGGSSMAWRLISDIGFADGRMSDAVAALDRALVHAIRAGDASEQTAIYGTLGTVFARGSAPVGAAIRRCREVLAATEGDRTIAAGMYHALGHLVARQGAFDEALDLAERCREIYRENGAMWTYWVFTEIPWDILRLAGRPEEAFEILSEGYQQVESMGEEFPLLAVFVAQSLEELGRYDEAERVARTAVDAHDDALGRHAGMGVLARILAGRGELDEAERMAREAVAFFEVTEFGTEQTSVLLDLAEVLRLAGRPDEAAIVLRQALELFEEREDVVSSARTRAAIADLG
jgi:tetratricopeptide (TPR) repeat protein